MGLSLADGSKVYLDSAVLIYSVEKVEPFASALRPLWEGAAAGRLSLYGSELLLVEVLVAPLRKKDGELEATYRQMLSGATEIRILPIERDILEQAVQLRADLGIKTPDAIHAATAQAAGCDVILTNDDDFVGLDHPSVILLRKVI